MNKINKTSKINKTKSRQTVLTPAEYEQGQRFKAHLKLYGLTITHFNDMQEEYFNLNTKTRLELLMDADPPKTKCSGSTTV